MADTKQLINREDSLLIVIDAQEKLMPAVAEKEKVAANLKRLVKFANINLYISIDTFWFPFQSAQKPGHSCLLSDKRSHINTAFGHLIYWLRQTE